MTAPLDNTSSTLGPLPEGKMREERAGEGKGGEGGSRRQLGEGGGGEGGSRRQRGAGGGAE